MLLKNRTAVITGGSRGLGLCIADAFIREGASVLISARDQANLESARESLQEKFSRPVHALACDLASTKQVDALASEARKKLGAVDILIANGGVQGPAGPIDEVNWEKWVETIQIDLIGTVYCCRAFVPGFKIARGGKILILSGGGATKPNPYLTAYAAAKAGLVRFGESLAEELQEFGIDVNMIAPGALNTRMLDEVLAAGPSLVGKARYDAAVTQHRTGGASPDRAAQMCVHLATTACDGITGRLISAPWDPWEKLQDLKHELMTSDIFTLRRIIPTDRGKNWDTT